MSTPPEPSCVGKNRLTDAERKETLEVVEQCKNDGLTMQEAASQLGLKNVRSLRGRLYRMKQSASRVVEKPDGPQFPTFSDDDLPVKEIIGHLSKRVVKKMAREKEERWYTIKMPDDLPWGGLIFGDQHMGTHCNWPLLQEHCEIARKTKGLYGISVGDLCDSWPLNGRLARLWADNDISLSTEWKLIEWFTQDAGITWLAYILGNHDTFNTNSLALFEKICKDLVPVHDGEAKFVVRTPNGAAFPIWVRHDFKGHSQFNALHGLMRNLREKADVERGMHILGVQGHRHHWAISSEEVPDKGYMFSAVRAQGYKVGDHYAKQLGFVEQDFGASIVYVCNPQARNLASQTSIWVDVQEGAEYLTWLRRKHSK